MKKRVHVSGIVIQSEYRS